jgi:hypothetical protein
VKKTGKNNLVQENERLRKENARLFAENERLRQGVKLLNEKIDWLMKKMFGSSSEALNSNQLDLFAVLPETQAPEPDASLLASAMIPAKSKTKSPRRERIPENLPVEKVVIDPILSRLKRALEKMEASQKHLPSSAFGKAINYTLSHWGLLTKYVANVRIGIDNNGVENAIRPIAIGKKNWLFFGDADAGEPSAVIYRIIESSSRRGIDPHEYLCDVLTRITKTTSWQVADLTPKKWAEKKSGLRKTA